MNFGMILEALMDGRRVSRKGWNGKSMFIALQRVDINSKMTLPYIYMQTATGGLVPWVASHADLLSEDWVIES